MSNKQVYELFIRTTPEKLWRALTDGAVTAQYFFGTSVASKLEKGAPITWTFPDGSVAVDGVVSGVESPRRLAHTWVTRYDPALSDECSDVVWSIEPRGEVVKLVVEHELSSAPKTAASVGKDGWSLVLSGLKTVLETGAPLPMR